MGRKGRTWRSLAIRWLLNELLLDLCLLKRSTCDLHHLQEVILTYVGGGGMCCCDCPPGIIPYILGLYCIGGVVKGVGGLGDGRVV